MTVTEQEFYDRTIQHLLDQGQRAADGDQCLYLDSEGRKCGIGYWIPDGHAAQSHRGSVGGLLAIYPDLVDLIPRGLASPLQILHDDYMFSGGFKPSFKGQCRSIAERFGLTPFDFDKAATDD